MVLEIQQSVMTGGWTQDGEPRTKVFRNHQIPNRIGCHNPMCRNGGLAVRPLIVDLFSTRKRRLKTIVQCPGNEHATKHRGGTRPCINFFKVMITVG
ncbi:MAG: hypothetical protein Kow0059_22300 [Candidatus Sumerlaeia bacterium]